jgi:FtsH-binding integral membrane protein
MKLSTFDLTRSLFLFTVVVLTVFGIGSLLRITANPDRTLLYGFYAFAMFGDALAMLFCVWLLHKRMKFAFHISVLVLVLNILPTIFDQFGLVDFLFVLLNLFTLGALVMARKELLPA